MKAFTLTLVAALTLLASGQASAKTYKEGDTLPCGQKYHDASVTLTSTKGNFAAANLAAYKKSSNSATGAVDTNY